jgi:septal ring-binding cell division protein DamX
MRIERALLTGFLILLTPALAFEPGSAKTCMPSADGARFECIEKGAESEESRQSFETRRREIVQSTAAASAAAVAAANEALEAASKIEDAPQSALAQSARSLPNYLRNAPVNDESSIAEPTTLPASRGEISIEQTTATPPSMTTAPTQDQMPTTAPSANIDLAPAPEVAKDPLPELQPEPRVAETPAKLETVPTPEQVVSTPTLEANEQATDSTPAAIPVRRLSSAGFAQLNAARFTLELAKGRDIAALHSLANSLNEIAGTLYLLEFSLPDGIWYSLVWSDFATPEAARDARAGLPEQSQITSGWPRRIGPLQKEISR